MLPWYPFGRGGLAHRTRIVRKGAEDDAGSEALGCARHVHDRQVEAVQGRQQAQIAHPPVVRVLALCRKGS